VAAEGLGLEDAALTIPEAKRFLFFSPSTSEFDSDSEKERKEEA